MRRNSLLANDFNSQATVHTTQALPRSVAVASSRSLASIVRRSLSVFSARDLEGEWQSRYRVGAGGRSDLFEWRQENKMRTVACALCLCLNIGTDPPGIDKPTPCACLECWIDPAALQPPAKSMELIANTLQTQYMRLQPKAKFEQLLDPTSGSVKRLCQALRKHAKHERILFHYNGHGVPRPTTNGEIWVFDKSYTLYVPLSIDDLLSWLGGPAILVLDCNGAGALADRFSAIVRARVDEKRRMEGADPERAALMPDYSECILLGCCSASQSLPFAAHSMPLDLFTSCLTTPLRMGLKFFAEGSVFGTRRLGCFLNAAMGEELLDKIPGKVADRKTALGELNWIYTAVTDTIAWNLLPAREFARWFRQDMLLASLLRNYLLATRIMAHFGCTTFSLPGLPHASLIAKHPLWLSWDCCLEQYLLSLDKYLNFAAEQSGRIQHMMMAVEAQAASAGGVAANAAAAAAAQAAIAAAAAAQPKFSREHINFFSEHLTAFEVWLEVGCENMGPPIQLPIVLQVLLSQVHRRRALILLARFLGKGSWAVNQALAVGIFPYVLKLLQSPDLPLREVLIFIWTKLLALDRSCQVDVIREKHEAYFVNHLAAPAPVVQQPQQHQQQGGQQQQPNAAAAAAAQGVTERQRVMSAFVLSALCDGYPVGQSAVLRTGVLRVVALHLDSESPALRKWMCLLLGKVWEQGFEEAKSLAISQGLPERLCAVIADPVPEVRAAALFALGTFMSAPPASSLHGSATPPGSLTPEALRERHSMELMLAKNFSQLVVDASPLVRVELVIALSQLVESQRDEFVALAHERLTADDPANANDARSGGNVPYGSSVPPSPSHGLMGSGMFAYPSSATTHSASAGNLAAMVPGSYGSQALAGPPPPHGTSIMRASSTAGAGAGSAHPGHLLVRTVSEPNNPHPPSSSPPPAAAGAAQGQGLAISLSHNMIAATGAPVAALRVTTPLSPLQLHPNYTPRAGATAASASAAASPAAAVNSVPVRPPLTRPHSSSHLSGSGGNSHSAEAVLYQQRLLIWRVVRTLSHDPFPSVARAAIALRKLVVSRTFSTPPSVYSQLSSNGTFHSQPFMSLQGSPLIQSSNLNSALHIVPEQSLTEYDVERSVSRVNPTYDPTTPTAHGAPNHSRNRSDSSVTRSRPVSSAGEDQQSNLAAPANILGAMSLAPPGASVRAPSPGSRSGPPASPGLSPMQAPSNAPRRAVSGGQRLVFDEGRFDSTGSAAAGSSSSLLPPSSIYARAAEYFVAPVGSAPAGPGMPGAGLSSSADPSQSPEKVLEQMLTNDWRRKRNADIMHVASSLRRDSYDVAERGGFEQVAALSTGFEQVSALLFHPFESLLVVAEKRNIALWDHKEFDRVNLFSNGNTSGTKISALSWINQQAQSLLMAGSDDGVVRLWKNVHVRDTAPEIVSAWLAVRSMPRGPGVGLVLDWQQETGHLLAAGPVDTIRVWDVEREICVLDLPVDSASYVSSLCSMEHGSVVFAGCGDGLVRMFDLRTNLSSIHTVSRHPGAVINVHVQRWAPDSDGDLISGGSNGDIHVSDTRMLGSRLGSSLGIGVQHQPASVVKCLFAFERPGIALDALAVHNHAPLVASGSRKQVVRVADFKGGGGGTTISVGPDGIVGEKFPVAPSVPLHNGAAVSTLKYHKGFMGHRIGPVTALAFHPHKLILAVGAMNPLVSIMAAFPPSTTQ